MYDRDLCNRCNLPGHLQKDCSLNWRRYVFCREPTRIEVARANSMLSPNCYICASNTHWGDECPSRRRSENSIFHTPILDFLQMTLIDQGPATRGRNRPHSRGAHFDKGHYSQTKGSRHSDSPASPTKIFHPNKDDSSLEHNRHVQGHSRYRNQTTGKSSDHHMEQDNDRPARRDYSRNSYGTGTGSANSKYKSSPHSGRTSTHSHSYRQHD